MDKPWFDATKISLWRLCQQKYKYRIVDQLVPVDQDTTGPLNFGLAIHKSLESIYNGSGKDLTSSGKQKYQQVFLDAYPNDPESPRSPYTRAVGLELLTAYLLHYHAEDFETVSVEQTFETTLVTPQQREINLMGRIDLIADMHDKRIPLDHKTTSAFNERFTTQFLMNPQIMLYIHAMNTDTAMINAIKVTKRIDSDNFHRQIIITTAADRKQVLDDICITADEIIKAEQQNKYVRHAPFACYAYNRLCEYYTLCSCSSKELQDTITNNCYTKNDWLPL